MDVKENLTAILYAKNDMRLANKPIPEISDNEVLIRMGQVGICGSDVHYLQNGCIGDFILKAPMVIGHEGAGTVVKCGAAVKNLQDGDRVAIEPGVPCRMCDHCKTGRYNLCKDIYFCATPPDDGNLCRYYKHAADFCFKLPNHVSLEEGAMLEPLSVGVHACRRAGVTFGSRVLIIGAGPIGLVNLLVAKAMGAVEVVITDVVDQKLRLAKELGADHAINAKGSNSESLAKDIANLLGNGGPNISIECSGAEAGIKLAMLCTRSGGVVVLVGLGAPLATVPVIDAAVREVDVRGIFRYANCYPTALELVSTGKVNLKPLITHRFSLEETMKAFETAISGEAVKVMIAC